MFCWMFGETRLDKIRNDSIKEIVGLAPIVKTMVETRLR